MVGNVPFANFVTGQGNNYRVTHKQDPVPKLPGYLLRYAHISPEYWITSASGANVTIQNIKSSTGAINVLGNVGTFGSTVGDHMWYFGAISACSPQSLGV
jgi:hypothetical protein